jgi:hypothetical protein
MAPRLKKRQRTATRQERTTPILDELGLEKGVEVRFRRGEGQDWLYGTILGDNKDGSLSMGESKTGHFRAFMPEQTQRKVRGPRGGIRWEPVVQ